MGISRSANRVPEALGTPAFLDLLIPQLRVRISVLSSVHSMILLFLVISQFTYILTLLFSAGKGRRLLSSKGHE